MRLPATATAPARGLERTALFDGSRHGLLERGFGLGTAANQGMDAYLRGIGLPPAP